LARSLLWGLHHRAKRIGKPAKVQEIIMFSTSDIQRMAVSAIGALLVSTSFIVATVAPAKAAEPNAPLTIADWQGDVGRQIDARMQMPAHALDRRDHAVARVDARFDADGALTGVTLNSSSGVAVLDQASLRTARQIAYPPLPAGLRGKPQTVTLVLYYGTAATDYDAARQRSQVEALARGEGRHDVSRTAALPTG
jgi:TonB family protein